MSGTWVVDALVLERAKQHRLPGSVILVGPRRFWAGVVLFS